jgi:hypothetical protein
MLDRLLKNRTCLIQATLVAAFSLPVLAHIYAGQFTRMIFDDYWFAHGARSLGWKNAQVDWYQTWQGTFSSTAVQTAVGLIGPGLVHLLPVILLTSWLVGMIWTVYQFGQLVRLHYPVFSACFFGSLILYATVEGAPNIFQSLYWTSGSVTYTLPMVIFTFYVGYILLTIRRIKQARNPVFAVLLSALITFVAGGFSPIYAAIQGSALGLAVVACIIISPPTIRQAILAVLLAGLLGTIAALVLMVSAPGNAIRQVLFPDPPPLPELLILNGAYMASFLATALVIFAPLEAIIALVIPGIIVNKTQPQDARIQAGIQRHARRYMALVLVIGLGLLYSIFIPTTYNVSDIPPPRALIIPHFVVVLVVLGWGIIMGLSLQRPQRQNTDNVFSFSRITLIVLAILLVLGPIRSTWNTLRLASDFRTFAAEWDAHDRAIRAAVAEGKTEMAVPAFTVDLSDYVDIRSIGNDPAMRPNQCVAAYYGLESLIAQTPDGRAGDGDQRQQPD